MNICDFLSTTPVLTLEQVQNAVKTCDDINIRNKDGSNALMIAVNNCLDIEILKTLINAGVNPNARDANGHTALMLGALNCKSPATIELLLELGAIASFKSKDGKTALDYAKRNPYVKDTDALRVLKERAFVESNKKYLEELVAKGEAVSENILLIEILQAKEQPSLDAVTNLIKKIKLLDVQDLAGKTALMYAAANAEPPIITALLDAGANTALCDSEGWSPLTYAAAYNINIEVADTLIKSGADVFFSGPGKKGQGVLQAAAKFNNNPAIFDILLRAMGEEAQRYATYLGPGGSPIICAVECNRSPAVFRKLLSLGANLSDCYYGSSNILIRAIINKQSFEIFNLLMSAFIKAGLDIDSYDSEGFTALKAAIRYTGSVELIKLLLDVGSDVNHVPCPTPLMVAAESNSDPTIVSFLLQAGANPNISNIRGETALMYAAKSCSSPAIITTLLQAGADPKRKDKKGLTAFDYAKENKNLVDTDVYWSLNDSQFS